MRKLVDGTTVPELAQATTLSIKTKCPAKWLLVDRETGEVYEAYSTPGPLQWKQVDPDILKGCVK